MRFLVLSFFVALFSGPAAADQFDIDPHLIDRCLAINDETPMRCVGRQADACAQRNGDGANMVLSVCLENESKFWDGFLNQTYARLLDAAITREDADIGYNPESLVDAVRDMQRSWIAYRDATCHHAFVFARPFNSAIGPAINECVMRETARQVFQLQTLERMYRR